jgi:Protein of unknown function (DUF3987)
VNALADEVEKRQCGTHPTILQTDDESADFVDLARNHLAKHPPAVSGQDGHNQTFRAACILILGFNLNRGTALELLREWNGSCQPPWSEKELEHKIDDADKEPGERGYLLHRAAAANRRGTSKVRTPIARELVAAQPFPVHVLPGAIGKFVGEAASAIGCAVSFIALGTLVCLAQAIGNKRVIHLKRTWTEPAILWGAIVAKSGSHKTPALAAATAILNKKQSEAMEKYKDDLRKFDQIKANHLIEHLNWKQREKAETDPPPQEPKKPALQRLVVSDITIEALADRLDKQFDGVLVVRDELAGWLGGIAEYKGGKGSDLGHWLACWSAAPFTVDRKTGPNPTIHVPRGAVNILGGIQPGVMRSAIGREHMQDGLCARLLLTMPEHQAVRWTEATISPETEAELAKVFGQLLALEPDTDDGGKPAPLAMSLSPEAKIIWIEYFNRHRAEMSDLDENLAAAWSKLEAYAARFALVIQLCANAERETNDIVIDEQSIKAGIELADWFGNEAKRVYDVLQESADAREQRELIELIRRRGGTVSIRELMRMSRRFPTADDALAALEPLTSAGFGRFQAIPVGPNGGRRTECFTLFDSADVDNTLVTPGESAGYVNDNTEGSNTEHNCGGAGRDETNRLVEEAAQTNATDDT